MTEQQAAPRRRVQVIARLFFVALVLGVLFAARHVLQQPAFIPPHILTTEREEQFNRQLDQFVKLNFGRPVMLKNWLDEWTRQTGIPVEVRHGADLSQLDVSSSEVSLDLSELPARSALDTLGERFGAEWEHQEHERIILHWYRRNAVDMQHDIVTFPAPDFLAINYPT
jgi:hypothetical protein